jgi:hypothetical protein
MQLACGSIDKQNWADINAALSDKVSADGADVSIDLYQGSHLCHNGESNGVFCRNVFCLRWESGKDNQAWKCCHTLFLQYEDEDLECICGSGVTVLCKHRANQTAETVHATFMGHFNTVQQERGPSNRRMSRFRRCPFAECSNHEFATVNGLSDCFQLSTLRAMVKHLDSALRAELGMP